ncbi:MAG: thioredoxin family protein, partial [Nitrospinota bacterium]
ELAGEYAGKLKVAKLNVDDNPKTASRFGIRGIPTLLLFKKGEVVEQFVGVQKKGDIKRAIESAL